MTVTSAPRLTLKLTSNLALAGRPRNRLRRDDHADDFFCRAILHRISCALKAARFLPSIEADPCFQIDAILHGIGIAAEGKRNHASESDIAMALRDGKGSYVA